MDITHHFQLGWKRLASQIRIPSVPAYIAKFKNYAKLAAFFTAALSLGILGHNESQRIAIEDWLKNDTPNLLWIEKSFRAFDLTNEIQGELYRKVLKTLPTSNRVSGVFISTNPFVLATVSKAGAIKIFQGSTPIHLEDLKWDFIELKWSSINSLFDTLQLLKTKQDNLLKNQKKTHPTDPYELKY